MNEMVERVTAAIHASLNKPCFNGCHTAGPCKLLPCPCANAAARAAIEAMREPTSAMVSAALETRGLQDIAVAANRGGYRATMENVMPNSPLQQSWRAMIDAALNER